MFVQLISLPKTLAVQCLINVRKYIVNYKCFVETKTSAQMECLVSVCDYRGTTVPRSGSSAFSVTKLLGSRKCFK